MLNDPSLMDGKTVLITGASSGVGLATALLLAERGAFVVMICRNPVRARFMCNEIAKCASGRSPVFFLADLSSQPEIHRLANELHASISRIDVLINCAGTVFTNREVTPNGVEKTLAVNHIATFLITRLLLDLVQAAPTGRILTVASGLHSSSLNFSNLQGEQHYNFMDAYRRSKLCNILFTYELARRLAGTAITANCLSPGPTLTRLGDNLTGVSALFPWVAKRIPFALGLPEGGAWPIVYAATSPTLAGVTGRFFQRGRDTRTKPITYNNVVAENLWRATEALCDSREAGQDIDDLQEILSV
jgi:NAD(P)-dependent dehydrogenase (short-subunit alcohol dehydrogenase family)